MRRCAFCVCIMYYHPRHWRFRVDFLFFLFRFNSILCVFRIVQRLGEWCKAKLHLRTAPRPFQKREIRFLPIAVTLLIRPESTFFPEMLRRGSGVWKWAFSLRKYSDGFDDNPTPRFSLRHLQREIENQNRQAAHVQQQIRRFDEDIRQNQELLRRACTEQKSTKVTHLQSVRSCITYISNKCVHLRWTNASIKENIKAKCCYTCFVFEFILGQDHKATTGTHRPKKCGRTSVWGPETSGLCREKKKLFFYIKCLISGC